MTQLSNHQQYDTLLAQIDAVASRGRVQAIAAGESGIVGNVLANRPAYCRI